MMLCDAVMLTMWPTTRRACKNSKIQSQLFLYSCSNPITDSQPARRKRENAVKFFFDLELGGKKKIRIFFPVKMCL